MYFPGILETHQGCSIGPSEHVNTLWYLYRASVFANRIKRGVQLCCSLSLSVSVIVDEG